MFLPDTPYPACGSEENSNGAADEPAVPHPETTTDRHDPVRKRDR
jgi:hypothetical protein